jgi:hypothetical protein
MDMRAAKAWEKETFFFYSTAQVIFVSDVMTSRTWHLPSENFFCDVSWGFHFIIRRSLEMTKKI